MKPKILILILICVLTIIAVIYDETDVPMGKMEANRQISKQDTTKLDIALPAVHFKSFEGEDFALADFSDKIVVINFWASWCPPCIKELPELFQLANEYDIIFIAANLDQKLENATALIKKIKKKNPDMIIPDNAYFAWDPKKKIALKIFHTTKYPETYVIGKNQHIKAKIVGDDLEKLEGILKSLSSLKSKDTAKGSK